jgi:hypothetical protein
MPVPRMRRVETAAQQPDARPAAIAPEARRCDFPWRGFQGRTCPLPMIW